MTHQYDRLKEGPQTDIQRSDLSPLERSELRMLRVVSSKDTDVSYPGRIKSVYYLEGSERLAAKRFAEENREQLDEVDFSRENIVSSSLPREAYDWVLHFLGERELRKYRTVVYERRRDGTEWVIERTQFDTDPVRRYTTSEGASVKVDSSISIAELYDELDDRILHYDLADHKAVEGSVKWLLEYFRISGSFDCKPITYGDWPAIEKRDGD